MATEVLIRPQCMVDPRGESRREPVALAARHAELKDKKVLLFDNTQLNTLRERFGPLFRWLSAYLQSHHGAKCSTEARSLLKGSLEEHAKLADELSQSGVDAVVLALCNAGVTQATTIFAAELERRGVPCVLLCTELGHSLAGVTATWYVPGLPIVLVSPATGEPDDFGKVETNAIAPQIAAGLTTTTDALIARFETKFSSESPRVADDGKLVLPAIAATAHDTGGGPTIDFDPSGFVADLHDELCAADMCDGLPVVPPTRDRVEAMLAYSDRNGNEVLVKDMPPSGGSITVKSLAANAVMAGCRPEYFPILIAAFEAIADPAYRIFQGAITSHPAGNAVIVSGPLAEELGIHSGSGCLGPGFRANATIGRALTLTIMNVARAIPGKSDLGVMGSPAEFSYCFAEIEKNHPWQPLHTDLYSAETTSVTVHKCEGPHNVLDPRAGPEELLRTIAAVGATPGGNNLVYLGQLLVILNPRQAAMIAKAGWSKRDVKEFLFEVARHPIELAGKQERTMFPPYFRKFSRVPVMRSPDDIIVVVCGGMGGHAMVSVPWGRARAVSRPVFQKDGAPLRAAKGR